MSKEYIGREAAILAVRHAWAKGLEPTQYIEQIPAAEVIEKKHGYWIKRIIENEKEDYPIRNVDYICSRCEGCWHEPLKYCPMCLAEMDKEEPNEMDKREG